MKKYLCFQLAAFILLVAGCGWPAEPQNIDLSEKIKRVENGLLLTQSITARMEHHKVPGVSVAVVNHYELEWARGYGVLELGRNEPVTPDTLFQAGSVAKTITAVGALHYVEQGLLSLDENVNDRLVSWQVPENEFTKETDVTLRRLLSHTAGLNQGLNRGYAPGEDVPTILQSLDGVPPANSLPVRVDRIPGSDHYYSNGGYLIIAQLLEDVLNMSFSQAMEEVVFAPLGMRSSTFEQALPADLFARTAAPHGWDGISWQLSPGLIGQRHINDPGYGGLWTTAPDLALFAAEIMRAHAAKSDLVLSQEMTRTMLIPVVSGIPLQEPFDAEQALGFSLIHIGSESFIIHFGGSFPGYISVLMAQPERGFGVAILTNSWTGYELIWEILYSIFYAYGILPAPVEILNMSYALVLFFGMLILFPVDAIAHRLRVQRLEHVKETSKQRKGAGFAAAVVILTVTAILALTLLYRGPFGGCLVPDRGLGEPPLVKALFGLFFSMPIFLTAAVILVWKRHVWSFQRRVQYTLIAAGALAGIIFLGDLWGLMFWL